jgi:hypothetical protein
MYAYKKNRDALKITNLERRWSVDNFNTTLYREEAKGRVFRYHPGASIDLDGANSIQGPTGTGSSGSKHP